MRIAVETALDEINSAGGVLGKPLKLVFYDDVGEPARAVDNARRIGERDNCVVMIGGGGTPNAIALREPLAEMGLPWIGPISAGTRVIEHENGKNEWMFRISMKDRWVAGYLVDTAHKRNPSGKFGIIYEGTRLGPGRRSRCRSGDEAAEYSSRGQGDREYRRPGCLGADRFASETRASII